MSTGRLGEVRLGEFRLAEVRLGVVYHSWRHRLALALHLGGALLPGIRAQDSPGEATVSHRGEVVVTYRARLAGEQLVVEARHQPPWHTYAMDNLERAQQASGKPEPETELPTRIEVSGGLEVTGGWRQTPPEELSQPEIRWYTWGFSDVAWFAVPVERQSGTQARVSISGQACTESQCARIDDLVLVVSLDAPPLELEEIALERLVAVGDEPP